LTDGYAGRDRERWVVEGEKCEGTARDPFVRDRARVLHSAALRRLAAKTQVVIVGESDFPRTRLTHSLECAQIGRELASALGADAEIVDAACLAHDLGHPPFGHNGETALATFAEDIGGFEGNAQSLRVLTRLEAKVLRDDGSGAGLNLTRAVLDAATKYPWPRQVGNPKFGVYADDRPVFDWLRDGAPEGHRCIEAQLMDWADDVAFSVHDVEDGVHARHVSPPELNDPDARAAVVEVARASYLDVPADDLHAAFDRLTELPFWIRGFDGSLRSLAALKRFTSEMTARLCSAAVRATREQYGTGPIRRYDGNLVVPADTRAECAVLKAVAGLFVIQRETTMSLKERQREQLTELLDRLTECAPGPLEPWLREMWERAPDDTARRRVVVDQVASLTDVSALIWHERELA
jgi:dGTPase